MNLEVRLLNLLVTFDSDKTLKLVFITLSLRVKVLNFHKEGEFKKEEDDDRVNRIVLTIIVKQNI